jgi:nucleotide-binding universal stress UspA family protein
MEGDDDMTKVIAGIDETSSAGRVLATAKAAARLFGATVEAVHVCEDGADKAGRDCKAAGISLQPLHGDVIGTLTEIGSRREVTALVLGTRDIPSRTTPLGSTALEVIGRVEKPVVLVPPRGPVPRRIRQVLLPLEGTRPTSLAPAAVLEVATDAAVDLLALHVLEASNLPLFTDQPQHETDAWAKEFVARYCPRGLHSVRLALRIGTPDAAILAAAEETGADLVVLGWNQRLVPGRAAVVRRLLERGTFPLLLIPTVRIDDRERRKVA